MDEKTKVNLRYIKTVTLRTLDDILKRRSESGLPDTTAFSVKQTHLFPDTVMKISHASDMAIFLSSPSVCEKYGRWAIAPERDSKQERVVVFVPVPAIENVEEL